MGRYHRVTVAEFGQRLAQGKYTGITGARRAAGRALWSASEQKEARRLVERYFHTAASSGETFGARLRTCVQGSIAAGKFATTRKAAAAMGYADAGALYAVQRDERKPAADKYAKMCALWPELVGACTPDRRIFKAPVKASPTVNEPLTVVPFQTTTATVDPAAAFDFCELLLVLAKDKQAPRWLEFLITSTRAGYAPARVCSLLTSAVEAVHGNQ